MDVILFFNTADRKTGNEIPLKERIDAEDRDHRDDRSSRSDRSGRDGRTTVLEALDASLRRQATPL